MIDAELGVAGGVVRVLLAPRSGVRAGGFFLFGFVFLLGVLFFRVLFLFRVFLFRILLFGVFLVRVLRSAFIQGRHGTLTPLGSWVFGAVAVLRPRRLAILCIVFAEHLTVGFAVLARNEGGTVNGRLRGTPKWS